MRCAGRGFLGNWLAILLAVAVLAMVVLAVPSAEAVEPSEMLDDPAQEKRARDLSEQLRCLVCQNQSIDESNAQLAQDMRRLVRERIAAGDSDAEIKAYLTARYGDFVLLKPPMRPGTYVLWYGPAVLVVLGALGIAVYFRRRHRRGTPATEALSEAERTRIAALLEAGEGPNRPHRQDQKDETTR